MIYSAHKLTQQVSSQVTWELLKASVKLNDRLVQCFTTEQGNHPLSSELEVESLGSYHQHELLGSGTCLELCCSY
jgi:hypothetical protein